MRNKFYFVVALSCGLFGFNQISFAKNGSDNGTNVVESEHFEGRFVLSPTNTAPEGASGEAEVQVESEEGGTNNTATIKLDTKGLDAGDYILSIDTASFGSIVLGQFTVVDTGDKKLKSENEADLPGGGVGVRDITQVVVSDLSSTPLLVGGLGAGEKSKSVFTAVVPFVPGPAAPDATGSATLTSTSGKGKNKDTFVLNAFNVPTNSTFGVEVNGTVVGTATSKKNGKVTVKKLPVTGAPIQTVRLLDNTLTEVGRVEF